YKVTGVQTCALPIFNSSTTARNRLSCPISRNARLRARMTGAAPAKTPVSLPSSEGCWVAWARATESCCCTWLRSWLAGRRDQVYLSGGGSPLARLVRDFFPQLVILRKRLDLFLCKYQSRRTHRLALERLALGH